MDEKEESRIHQHKRNIYREHNQISMYRAQMICCILIPSQLKTTTTQIQ